MNSGRGHSRRYWDSYKGYMKGLGFRVGMHEVGFCVMVLDECMQATRMIWESKLGDQT